MYLYIYVYVMYIFDVFMYLYIINNTFQSIDFYFFRCFIKIQGKKRKEQKFSALIITDGGTFGGTL